MGTLSSRPTQSRGEGATLTGTVRQHLGDDAHGEDAESSSSGLPPGPSLHRRPGVSRFTAPSARQACPLPSPSWAFAVASRTEFRRPGLQQQKFTVSLSWRLEGPAEGVAVLAPPRALLLGPRTAVFSLCLFFLIIYLFLAVLSLCRCLGFASVEVSGSSSLAAERGRRLQQFHLPGSSSQAE